jgi:16S rRNA G966 N2-methylase RsmD
MDTIHTRVAVHGLVSCAVEWQDRLHLSLLLNNLKQKGWRQSKTASAQHHQTSLHWEYDLTNRIFLDPPLPLQDWEVLLKVLKRNAKIMSAGGIIVRFGEERVWHVFGTCFAN